MTMECLIAAATRKPVIAVYKKTVNQSIPNTTSTIVDYETAIIDSHGAVTVGAGWVFTVPRAGYYMVGGGIAMTFTTTWAEQEFLMISAFVNGGQSSRLDIRYGLDSSAVSSNQFAGGMAILQLAAGDTLNLRVSQVSGAALSTTNNPDANQVRIAEIR